MIQKVQGSIFPRDIYIVIAENPPSTLIIAPVTKDDAFEDASQIMAPTSSSGSPNRPSGVCQKLSEVVYSGLGNTISKYFCNIGVPRCSRNPFQKPSLSELVEKPAQLDFATKGNLFRLSLAQKEYADSIAAGKNESFLDLKMLMSELNVKDYTGVIGIKIKDAKGAFCAGIGDAIDLRLVKIALDAAAESNDEDE